VGRQIAIAMNPDDEGVFWKYLHSVAEVDIYRSWSPSEAPVGSFVVDKGAHTFYIHNKAFPWKPEFERVDYTDRETGQSGTYYRIAYHHAPLVHYSRHPGGRLYWPKFFVSQPDELHYDVDLFDKWFNSLMRWTRKLGVKTEQGIWALPGARAKIEAGS
jgi:hypothetical protein